MTDLTPSPAPRRPRPSALARYGPVTAIGVALVVIALLATVGASTKPASSTGASSLGVLRSDPSLNPNLPVTYGEALARGLDVAKMDFGKNCDPKTTRLMIPSVYAPPCLAAATTVGQGKATVPGVTGDTIKVVYYVPPANGGISSTLQAFQDPIAKQIQTAQGYVNMLNHLFRMWGRHIEVVRFDASGADDDVQGARADALKVANDIKPFASLGGPNLTPAYADELAKHKILCLGCGLAVPDVYFQQNAPYLWGSTPTPEQYLVNLGDYIVNRLNGRPAAHAGPELKDKTRKFGVVHFEQDPPVFGKVNSVVEKEGARRGYKAAVSETYVLDVPKLPERAATIIAKMKAAGVTSIIFLGDPIMPISLTKEATKQSYFPEWIVTGTVLTDTTTLGRIYDQQQWAHAFGLSNLAVREPLTQQEPFRLYSWFYKHPPEAPKTAALIANNITLLATGVMMAGPDLRPETFEGGMYRLPPRGGGPTTPHISFGRHGYFANPDYLAIDDSTEIWWDPTAKGQNEQGADGTGMWRYSDGGRRYLPGTMPVEPDHAFIEAGSVTSADQATLTPEDTPPTYEQVVYAQ